MPDEIYEIEDVSASFHCGVELDLGEGDVIRLTVVDALEIADQIKWAAESLKEAPDA